MVSLALLGVREVLEVENLELAILLDEGDDGEAVILQRSTADGGPRGCELQKTVRYNSRGHDSWVQRQTWTTTLPCASITSWMVG